MAATDLSSPMQRAIRYGHEEVVRTLVALGESVNCDENTDQPIIERQVLRGNVPMVTLLVQFGARVDVVGYRGRTPLWNAAANNDVPMAERLLYLKASVDFQLLRDDDSDYCSANTSTPLWIAASNGHLEVLRVLLDANANVNACHYEKTPLFVALARGHVASAQLLAKAGRI